MAGPGVRYFAFALRAPLLLSLPSLRRTEVLSPPLRGRANQIAARFVAMLRLQPGGEGGIGGPVVRYFVFALCAPLLHSLRSFRRTEVLIPPLRGCAHQIAARFVTMLRLQHGGEGGIGGPVVRYFAFALRAPLLHSLPSFRRTKVFIPPPRGCTHQIAARFDAMLRMQHGGEGGIRTPGTLRLSGFQDRRDRPLCHLSGCREPTFRLQPPLSRITYRRS